MKKELVVALTLALASGLTFAADDAMKSSQSGSSASPSTSSSGGTAISPGSSSASGSENTKTSSGATSASQVESDGNAWMVELSADPKTALFQRLDADKNGYLNQQEVQGYKDEVTINLDRASSGSGDQKGVDIIAFKTAVTNSMLGLGGDGSNESLESFAHGGLDTTGPADTNSQGMQSDKVMDQVVEEQGGPTMLRGGPNPSPSQPTPEQTLTP